MFFEKAFVILIRIKYQIELNFNKPLNILLGIN